MVTKEDENGVNHLIERQQGFLTYQATFIVIHMLYIQRGKLKNENKNIYLFSYLESLVAWNVFKEYSVIIFDNWAHA